MKTKKYQYDIDTTIIMKVKVNPLIAVCVLVSTK